MKHILLLRAYRGQPQVARRNTPASRFLVAQITLGCDREHSGNEQVRVSNPASAYSTLSAGYFMGGKYGI